MPANSLTSMGIWGKDVVFLHVPPPMSECVCARPGPEHKEGHAFRIRRSEANGSRPLLLQGHGQCVTKTL